MVDNGAKITRYILRSVKSSSASKHEVALNFRSKST
jgi:hypothetical protein